MVGKYKVITLCGSTRFKDKFLEVQKELTLQGNIVISVGLFGHSGDNEVWTDGTKELLDDMHKRKIDMADGIFVINVDGYIGESTLNEIKYARLNKKTIEYLVPVSEDPVKEKKLGYCQHCKNIVDFDFNDSTHSRTTVEEECVCRDAGYGDDDQFALVERIIMENICPYCQKPYEVKNYFSRQIGKSHNRWGD